MPASGIPLLYFGFAHLSLALCLAILVARPDLPSGYFHHPRMIALVHLVTLGWISGSILGAFYIVAPLALGMPFRAGWRDRAAFGAFASGVAGMVAHFWIGEYSGMAWSALLVTAAMLHVGVRAGLGLRSAPVPWPITLHIGLAFVNVLAAAALGVVVGLNRLFGWIDWAPIASAFAHAHLAAVGWALMMVIGLSYRLVPMILPARMPAGNRLAASAVLLEIGVVGLVISLVAGPGWTWLAALVIVAGIACFVSIIRSIVRHRRPAPAALPKPDWATWQTHAAFVWLLVAAAAGLLLTTTDVPVEWMIIVGWVYGAAGLIGFLAQIVVGIQGRLLPLYAWYRAMEGRDMTPPSRSAHTLASPDLAGAILAAWTIGVPVLTVGLAGSRASATALGSAVLLAGVALNCAQMIVVCTEARDDRSR